MQRRGGGGVGGKGADTLCKSSHMRAEEPPYSAPVAPPSMTAMAASIRARMPKTMLVMTSLHGLGDEEVASRRWVVLSHDDKGHKTEVFVGAILGIIGVYLSTREMRELLLRKRDEYTMGEA